MSDNNRTVEPIIGTDLSAIITTLNHNFQVLTERIKELNLSLSYLDVLKVSRIFTVTTDQYPDGSEQLLNSNLQNFVATCWNSLANYNGVYIQCVAGDGVLFKFMGNNVKRGDFIIKLPNNQSLYLAGAQPQVMIPTSYSYPNIVYTPGTMPTEAVPVSVSFPIMGNLQFSISTYAAGSALPTFNHYNDIRFFTNSGEEVFVPNYTTDSNNPSTIQLPFDVQAHLIYSSIEQSMDDDLDLH